MSKLLLTPDEKTWDNCPVVNCSHACDCTPTPHHIDAWPGATVEDVAHTVQAVEFCFDAFERNVTALLQNINAHIPLNVQPASIESFRGTLADLRHDLIGDLMGIQEDLDD